MLLVANLVNTKRMQKSWKMTETLAHGFSSESTLWKLSNEYHHDRVQMVFKFPCPLDESSSSMGLKGEKQWGTHTCLFKWPRKTPLHKNRASSPWYTGCIGQPPWLLRGLVCGNALHWWIFYKLRVTQRETSALSCICLKFISKLISVGRPGESELEISTSQSSSR